MVGNHIEKDRMHRNYERSTKSPSADHANSSQSSNSVLNESKSSEPEREGDWNVTQEEMSDPESSTKEDESFKKPMLKVNNKKGNLGLTSFLVVITAIISLFIIPKLNFSRSVDIDSPKTSTNIKCEFDKLDQEYKGQDKYLWKSLETGLENILNQKSTKPAVYLILYRTNPNGEPAMIKKIVNRASECFDPSLKPMYMNLSHFSSEASVVDFGVVIENYKSIIKEGDVLLIVKLNDIPPKTARALHFICDVYSPIVERVVIFLTLEVPNLPQEKPSEIAHNALSKMWKEEMEENDLSPLITRVTEEVVVVRQ